MENYGRMRKTIPKESNSMKKFVRDFSEEHVDEEFCRNQDMHRKNNPAKSKLSLKGESTKFSPIFSKENFQRNKRKGSVSYAVSEQTGGFELMTLPKKKPLLEKNRILESTQSIASSLSTRPERELVVITGSVQFILKNFKLYIDLKALYEVYGIIMKINKGKIRFENIILMRSESGPVLQGFFFDFENILINFQPARFFRCVGNFNNQNRFHIHKIEQIKTPPQDTELTRIQNVSAFSLLQS